MQLKLRLSALTFILFTTFTVVQAQENPSPSIINTCYLTDDCAKDEDCGGDPCYCNTFMGKCRDRSAPEEVGQ